MIVFNRQSQKIISIELVIVFAIFILSFFSSNVKATVPTKVFFVGEDLYVVTSASKHPESPENAPAVVEIIDANQIKDYGIRTLGEALSITSGFYIAKREWGHQPFLRGIPDSFLFLYDSVPMTSDSTKSIFPLDEELSLDFVKQIEIIKGPASVLWGPDAFAGLVNIVPITGKDLDGVKLNFRIGTPNHEKRITLSLGKNFGIWDGFAAFSATSNQPFYDKYTVLKCGNDIACTKQYTIGNGELDNSKYFEAIFNFSWKDWLKFSGRWSTATNRYVVGEMDSEKLWPAKKKMPFRFIRLEAKKEFGKYNFRLSSYYSKIPYEEQLVDISWHSNSHVYYGEIFIDRKFWDSTALFTIGASYRYNKITGAVISKSYLPDYLQPGNPIFTPIINQKDFDTNLYSIYGQLRKHWKYLEVWAGLRFDNHSQYDNTISYNLGLRWYPNNKWNTKLLLGTAYRTPYNTQLVNRTDLEPEKIQNLTLELDYHPFDNFEIKLTGFWNYIKNHVSEDPTGGLSDSSSQNIYGIETSIKWKPTYWINFWFNSTLFNNYGDDEYYKMLDYIIIEPDGSFKPFYSLWKTPFETGPKNLFNIGFDITPIEDLTISTKLNYASSYEGFYDKGQKSMKSTGQWNTDITATYYNLFFKGVDAQIAIKNIFNEKYRLPGRYSDILKEPFAAYFSIHFHY